MKKGCLAALVIWAIAAAAYWMFLETRHAALSVWVPAGAGLIMSIAIAQLREAARWVSRARKIGEPASFMSGERPKDGEAITVTGRIRATGPVLTAPFSGKPAVLYSYDIKDLTVRTRTKSSSEPVSVYSGFALTPSVVDTPMMGAVRLLAFPMPDKSDAQPIDGSTERENAAAWIASTNFQDIGPLQIGAIYREMKDVMTDDDGEVRKDWRMSDDPDLEDKKLYEHVIPPGEQVCVMGRYSAAKGGIVPDFAGGNVVQLLRGDPQKVASSMRMKAVGSVIFAVLLAAATNGALYLYLTRGPR